MSVLNNKTTICLVIPSLQAGGMERVMSELARHFIEKEAAEVHLVVYGRSRELFYPVSDKLIVHRPGFVFDDFPRLVATLKSLWFVRRTIQQISPDTILSFGELWNSFVLLALIGTPYPVYISDRCQPNKVFSRRHAWLRRLLYPRATGMIAQTATARAVYAAQHLNARISVIANPVTPVLACSENETSRENIILTIGRLISTKHHDLLIQMFADTGCKDWRLIIVGGDALKQSNMSRLKTLIDSLGLQGKVILAGEQLDVIDYYRRSKIFAFTSSSEGFPNVIVEALSAGLPVISFDCVAGPSDMISDRVNGYLVPLFDCEGFKEKLKQLVNDETLRAEMAEHARRSVTRFHIVTIGSEYFRFITGKS